MHLIFSDAKKKDLKVGAKLNIRVVKVGKGGKVTQLGTWEVTLTEVEMFGGECMAAFAYEGSNYRAFWRPPRLAAVDTPGFLASKDGRPLD